MYGAVMGTQRLLTTTEAARRLGVKRETVYAYVSRGLLARHPSSEPRGSRFDPDAVERLAARARQTDRSGALEVVVETQLTALDPDGRLSYRGRDAIELARFRSFEDVVALLWDGDPGAPWQLTTDDRERVAAIRAVLGPLAPPIDRIPVVIAALAAGDGTRGDRRPEAVRRAGGRIFAATLEAIAGEGRRSGPAAAERVWTAVSEPGRRPRPAQLAALDSALVLLADHELAASTLAARVAASAWADPYRVVLAGLGPLGGTLHGLAGMAAEALLSEAALTGSAFAVLDTRMAAGGVPGFGHRVYRDRDPRADHLLARLPGLGGDPARLATVQATLDAAATLGLPAPNVDFGLAALAHVLELAPGTPTVIFCVARIAGLIAHALEEYPHRLRFRPRATYVGPAGA
jgi:citrate synthase